MRLTPTLPRRELADRPTDIRPTATHLSPTPTFSPQVPIKYIAEPGMHSMPAVTPSPDGGFMACQSLDNTIKVFGCRDRFKEMRKKVFRGHTNAGYACQIAFSPNSRFLASGDGEGKMHFWDWKTTRALVKYRAHDNGPCIGLAWHPVEPALVASCGWDGLVKLWDGN